MRVSRALELGGLPINKCRIPDSSRHDWGSEEDKNEDEDEDEDEDQEDDGDDGEEKLEDLS